MRSKTTIAEISGLIRSTSRKAPDPAGREVLILDDANAFKVASQSGVTVYDVYTEALRIGICPYRYLRNRESISGEEQFTLCTSCVAVVGAGGIGGHVTLLLARLGIGHIVVIDHDAFDETNLNRQVLASGHALGKLKPEEAVSVVGTINPGVKVTPHCFRIDRSSAREVLNGSDVIVDALANIPDRFAIEDASRSLGIPLVHGALAGFEGQIMTIFPEDPGLKRLYGCGGTGEGRTGGERPPHPEAILGVPAMTASLIGTLQAMEVLKIILKRGTIFRDVMFHVDLETGEMGPFAFGERD